MDCARLRFWTLYLTRLAGGFGFVALVTFLPKYINELDPGVVAVPELALGGLVLGGFSLSRGFVIGMFTAGFMLVQTVTVVPLSRAGDRYDKRLVLAGTVGLGAVVYTAFPLVDSSLSFILARVARGVAATSTGLMSLALVGELAREGTRANHIGKTNAARFAVFILGSVSAGILYDPFDFTPIFIIITVLLTIAVVAIWVFLPPDETRIRGFPLTDLALNECILVMATFRVQHAVAVTLVWIWVPIYAGVSAASGGLTCGGVAVAATVVAEKFTNMLCQPYTGRISDGYGRARFVFVGGGLYGLIALAAPFSLAVGEALALPAAFPVLGPLSPAFLPLISLVGLLDVADSLREPASMALFADEGSGSVGVVSNFGVRELLWRPGSVVAPLFGSYLMVRVGMEWVFFVGDVTVITGVLAFLAALT